MINIFILIWILFATFIGQIFIFLTGYTFLYFLPKSKDFPPLQKFAMSYGLGTGITTIFMFIFILFGVHARISFIPVLIISLILFIYFKIYKTLKIDMKTILSFKIKDFKLNYIEIFCIFVLLIEMIYIISICLIYPIYTWDPVVIWDSKAKFIFYDGNFSFYNYFTIHPSYPLLIPLNVTYFYSLYFQPHSFVQLNIATFFIFLIIFLYFSLRHAKLNRTYTIIICTMTATISDMFYLSTQVYGDIILIYYYTLSTIFLSYYFLSRKSHYLLYSSIFAGFMSLTKNEGLGLFIVYGVIFLIYKIIFLINKQETFKNSLKKLIIFILPGLIIYIPWQIFSLYNHIVSEYILSLPELLNIQSMISDLIIISIASLIEILWCPFWLIFIIVIFYNFRLLMKDKLVFLLILCISHILLKYLIYIISPYELISHLILSLNREFLHLAPIAAFLMGIIFANDKKRNQLDLAKNGDLFQKKIVKIYVIVIIIYMILIFIFYSLLIEFIPPIWDILRIN